MLKQLSRKRLRLEKEILLSDFLHAGEVKKLFNAEGDTFAGVAGGSGQGAIRVLEERSLQEMAVAAHGE